MENDKRFTVDPADFSAEQWNEMYYCAEFVSSEYDNAEPIQASESDIRGLIARCQRTRESIDSADLTGAIQRLWDYLDK